MMSTPNLRRSKREHVTRKCSSSPPCVGEGKAGIHESRSKSPQVAKDQNTKNMHSKIEGNPKNTSASKRLDARGYRQAVKEKFKGLKKKSGGVDKTKNQESGSLDALDVKTALKSTSQTSEHVALQLESKDRKLKDDEQRTESETGDSRQSTAVNSSNGFGKSAEKREYSYFSRKRKHQAEPQQDYSVSGTRSGKVYKCEVQELSDTKSSGSPNGGEKEGDLLDDSGMDLFVSMPIGDIADGQESANEDSKLDENIPINNTGPKKLVWAEIEKGKWWPAFTVVQSDQLQKNSSSLNKGLELAQLICSDDSRNEPKLVEARSFRPFGENYEELKNIHNNQSFVDAVMKAYKLYQDLLLKRNYLETSGQVEEAISPFQDKAIGKSDMDGVDPYSVTQMRSKSSKEVARSDIHHVVIDEPEEEGFMELRSTTGEDTNIQAPSPAQTSGCGGKSSTDGYSNFCQVCKKGGELLRCCDGKDCVRTYHLSCLDPPLVRVPPGDWYCPICVYKRISYGVYSVCRGIESIWEVKDVDSEQDEIGKHEKLYFVKYRGLSHLHNRWVNERLLLDEAPKKLANFKKKLKEGKAPKWNPEWAEPHRLIQKRSLICAKNPEEEQGRASVDRCIEWCIKWKGLGYDQCTWELENTPILTSNSSKELMKAYELQSEEARERACSGQAVKAKKLRNNAFSRLKKPPEWMRGGQECAINLKPVNKLREFWHNHRNALVIDEVNQERIMTMICFTLSLIKEFEITRPILIVTSAAGLSMWEAEFLQWAQSINTVVYCGNRNSRDVIQKLEFFEESGCMMVQIVLSTYDIVSAPADLNFLKDIEWEVLIIDECQRLKFSKALSQLDLLPVDFRLMLFNEQPKDNADEISYLLSFLDSLNEYPPKDSSEHQQKDGSEYLVSLKSRLSEYIAHERKSEPLSSANLIEYWVPVELANVQVEQYCTILMTNMDSLCKMLKKNDSVEALRDILLSLRKCCIHPYLVDISLQSSLREGLAETEFLDIDINASSKLQLLDNILSELRLEGQRVLILFQMIGRSGGTSIGDILDDHIRQRFGVDSYERVDGCLSSTKKHAALQMFNSKDSGRFVFLLEKRACGTSIKLSSIDTVIIFDSDWNPLSDLRALQKVQFDTHVEHLKVFRLYSPYTLEERVLISAKQDYVLDNHLENLNATVCQMLLKWGTSHLFESYDDLHDSNGHNLKVTSGYSNENLKSLAKDVSACAHHGFPPDNRSKNALIQRASRSKGYGKGVQLLGESDKKLTDENMPSNLFWAKLLKGRQIEKHGSSAQLLRTRKKVQYCERSPAKVASEPDEVEAKRKRRRVAETVDPMILTSWIQDKKKSLASGKETNENSTDLNTDGANQAPNNSIKDNSGNDSNVVYKKSSTDIHSEKYPSPCSGSCDAETGTAGSENENIDGKLTLAAQAAFRVEEHEDGKALRLAQQCLHSRLKPEIVELCKTLQLPEEVTRMAEEFLSYVMNNYRLPKEPTSLLQAVEISLCCAAAGCLKYNMDLETSIELAKSRLNFECKRAEIESVYSKLREQCLNLRRDIPRIAGQSGSRVTPSPVNSASQRCAEEIRSQDDGLSALKDDNQTGLNESGKEPLEETVTLNTQPVEDDPNHVEEDIETHVINQQELTLLDSMGVAHSSSGPEPDMPTGNQSDILSPEKFKITKEQIQARKQALLRQQQAEVAEFFRHREREIKKLEARNLAECHKIQTLYQNSELRVAKLKETKLHHAEMTGQLENHLKKALLVLKNRQSALREKENKKYATLLEHISAGQISPCDAIESSSVPKISVPLAQNSTSEACKATDNTLPSIAETGRSSPVSTSEQQQDKASLSESSMAVASSQSPEIQESHLLNGQTTLLPNDLPQNEIDSLHKTCRPRSSLERSRSRLRMPVPCQADSIMSSPDSQTQQQPNRHLSVQPDSTPLSRGAGEQFPQVSEQTNQGMPGIHRSQLEPVDNTLNVSPSLVTTVQVESSQPLQEMEVVERSGSAIETSTVACNTPRGNDSFQNVQHVMSTTNTMQFRIPASSRVMQTNFADPLYHEMLKIWKEQDRIKKLHEEETLRIQGEYEKELEELKKRYTALLQEKECSFQHKRRILETNFYKVDMNRRLAEAFKVKDANAAMPSGLATHFQQSRQQTTPVSNVRLSQLATPVVHSGAPMPVSELSTSGGFGSAGGIQSGGMVYLPMQSNDVCVPGSHGFSTRMSNQGMPLQNTQLGQATQSNSLHHNIGVVSDMLNRNIQPSTSGGLLTQARQLQAQGNIGEIVSNAYLSDANSPVSQRLQQQETGNLLGLPNGNYGSGPLFSGFMPVHQNQPNSHNQNSFVNANLPNAGILGADVIESVTQAAMDSASGNLAFLSSLQGQIAASQGERMDTPQVSYPTLQEMNRNPIVENFCSTNTQYPTQENVLLEDNANVEASLACGNNVIDACVSTRGPTSCAPESGTLHSSIPVPAQPICNNVAQCSNTPSVICLSDDD